MQYTHHVIHILYHILYNVYHIIFSILRFITIQHRIKLLKGEGAEQQLLLLQTLLPQDAKDLLRTDENQIDSSLSCLATSANS